MTAEQGGEQALRVRSSVARNASVLLGSQAITWLFALLVTTIQPRLLGPDNAGDLRIAFSIWAIADVFIALGMNQVVTIELARDPHGGAIVGRVLGIQLVLYALAAATVSAIVVAIDYDRSVTVLIALMALVSVGSMFISTGRAAFQGLERMGTPALTEILGRVIGVPVLIAVLVVTRSPVAAVLVAIGVNVLIASVMILVLRRQPGVSYWPTLRGSRELIRRAAPYFVNDGSLVLYQQVDTLVISVVATSAAVGWYSVADALMGSLLFLPSVLTTAVFPVLTRLHHEERTEELMDLVRRTLGLLMLAGMPIGVGVALVSRQTAELLWGPKFTESAPVLALFGISIIMLYPTIALAIYAVSIGRVKFWAILMLAMTALTIPLDLLLVPWADRRYDNGAIGGALSYVVTESIILVVALVVLTEGRFISTLTSRIVRIAAATAGMAAATWPVRQLFLPIPIAIGVVVYVALALVLGAAEPDEIDRGKRVLRSVRARLPGGDPA